MVTEFSRRDLPRLLFSIKETCERLGICKATFYARLVKTKRIKLLKIGRRSFVTPDELDRFTKDNTR
jgi:excisionase family DNA binding protein